MLRLSSSFFNSLILTRYFTFATDLLSSRTITLCFFLLFVRDSFLSNACRSRWIVRKAFYRDAVILFKLWGLNDTHSTCEKSGENRYKESYLHIWKKKNHDFTIVLMPPVFTFLFKFVWISLIWWTSIT